MQARHQSPANRACKLTDDIYTEILAKIPALNDKLAFGGCCKATWRALQEPRCWQVVDITQAGWLTGMSEMHLHRCFARPVWS